MAYRLIFALPIRLRDNRTPFTHVSEVRALRVLYGPGSARRVLAAATLMFVVILAVRAVEDKPDFGVGLFYLVPISLLALRFGLRGGLGGALVATILYCGYSTIDFDGLPTSAFVSRSLMFFIVGGIIGYLSNAMVDGLNKFDVALSVAPVVMFTTDTELRYTWLHDTSTRRIDIPLIGLNDVEILGPDNGARPQALKALALSTGESAHDVYEIVDPEGGSYWFSVTIEPIRDDSGKITGLTGAALDVTRELSATQALERSEARFRSAAENQLEPFALYSPMRDEAGEIVDFRCDFINQPGAESVAMACEEMVGRTLSELFPGRLELGLFDEYRKVVETGEPLFREAIDFINVLGEETLVRAFDIRVSKLDGGIQVTWRDITDRVRAERERDWIEALVENSRDGIMSVDLTGKIVSWSAGAERMYGYSREEAVGQSFTMLFTEDELAGRHERMQKLFAGESLGPLVSIEKRRDGSTFEADYTAAPIFDADGVVIGAARIVREHPGKGPVASTPADPPTHQNYS